MTHGAGIELCDPTAACDLLDVDDDDLLDLVNRGRLAAYDLDGAIRFRVDHVNDLAGDPVAD